MTRFTRFAAIDWSGQNVARPKGLALAVAEAGDAAPQLIRAERGWSRADLRDWIADQADEDMLIGLDLSPAFPFRDAGAFFPGWSESPTDMRALWALVEHLTAADAHLGSASFIAHPHAARHFRQTGRLGDLHPPGTRPPAPVRAWPESHGTVAIQLLQSGGRGAGREIEPDRHARAAPAIGQDRVLPA